MESNSPRKIQFTVPLLEPHLDPEAAEQIRRRRPTPATLVLSSDQSSPELQLLAEHHLCKQGSEDEGTPQRQDSLDDRPSVGCCCHGNTAPIQASQQQNPCSCFKQDGQRETNSLGERQDSQPDSLEGNLSDGATQKCGDLKEKRETKEHSSHIPVVQDK
ncbi:protein phosphatase 1 regulatory subunit 1A isoform 3-T4 [Discoglossus pictus]